MCYNKGVNCMQNNISNKKIHFIGIGGISMSGIARILLERGFLISGSDLKDNHFLQKLREKGADIFIGHAPENISEVDLVVISSAIPDENVELKYARQQGIEIWQRAQMISYLMNDKKAIAVSGTHGKTTTTSMISFILKKGGFDPLVLLGGEMEILDGNSCDGQGEFMVTEADESDGSLLFYDPHLAVVTNIELDHHDYYESKKHLLSVFEKFLYKIPPHGKAVVFAEDGNLQKIVSENDFNTLSYGINEGDVRAANIRLLPFGSYYNVVYKGKQLGEINLQVPGEHNILNSLAAITVAMFLGLNFTRIKALIEQYSGVKRRFEKKYLIDDVLIVDDYAHHPTEIEATLKTAVNTGYERIVAVFQPHRFSRTKHLMNEISSSFKQADQVILTDIYSAGEKESEDVKVEDLANMIEKNSKVDVKLIKDFVAIIEYLNENKKSKDLILTMGAGNVNEICDLLQADL